MLSSLRVLHEWVLHHVLSTWPLFGVFSEAYFHEFAHVLRPLFAVNLGGRHCQNHVAYLGLRQVQVWRLSKGKFKHHDTKTPYVDLLSIHLSGPDDLRCHPADCANFGVALLPFSG